MYKELQTRQELIRALQNPKVLFLEERQIATASDVAVATKGLKSMIAKGKRITLIALEQKP